MPKRTLTTEADGATAKKKLKARNGDPAPAPAVPEETAAAVAPASASASASDSDVPDTKAAAKKEKEAAAVGDLVQRFNVNVTGIPPSDLPIALRGTELRSAGAEMRLVGVTFPPRNRLIKRIQAIPALWAHYFERMKTLPQVREWPEAKLKEWIESGDEKGPADPNMVHLAANSAALVWISLKSGTGALGDLAYAMNQPGADPTDFPWFSREGGPFHTLQQALNRNAGCETLTLKPSAWVIAPKADGSTAKCKIVIGEERLQAGGQADDGKMAIVLEASGTVAVVDPVAYVAVQATNVADINALACGVLGGPDFKDDRDHKIQFTADASRFHHWCSEMHTPMLVSLLQKIVRQRPKFVSCPGSDFPISARTVALLVFGKIALARPTFVPSAKRTISGSERAFKRLAVTLVEDSAPASAEDVVFLLSCALMAARDTWWKPAASYVERAMRILLGAIETPLRLKYTSADASAPTVDLSEYAATGETPSRLKYAATGVTGWTLASGLFDCIGGMQGDRRMFRDLARNGAKGPTVIQPPATMVRPNVMSLVHCIDQHCVTSVIYFLDFAAAVKHTDPASVKGSAPYAKLFEGLFTSVTGVNSRISGPITTPFANEVVKAQHRCWAIVMDTRQKRGTPPLFGASAAPGSPVKPRSPFILDSDIEDAKTPREVHIHTEVPDAWLAAGVGHLKFTKTDVRVTGRRRTNSRPRKSLVKSPADPKNPLRADMDHFAVMKTHQLNDFTVLPNVGCDVVADIRVPQDMQEAVKLRALDVLKVGVVWSGVKVPIAQWVGSTIRLQSFTDEPTLRMRGSSADVPWSEARRVSVSLRTFAPHCYASATATASASASEDPLQWFRVVDPNGIEIGAFESMKADLRQSPCGVLMRMISLAGAAGGQFSMPDISRDGGSPTDSLSMYDIGAFQQFLRIAQRIPAAIVVSIAYDEVMFRVRSAPIMWEIMKYVRQIFAEKEPLTMAADPVSASASASASAVTAWPAWKDTMVIKGVPRSLRPHQSGAIEQMESRRQLGLRGHMVVCEVGQGKSMIAAQYMANLIAAGQMPRYCLVALPPESMGAVIAEFKAYGATVRVLDPCASSKLRKSKEFGMYIPTGSVAARTTVEPFAVNFVQHDHLRKLIPMLPSSVIHQLFFLLDEAHRTLRNSQRTNCSLDLAGAARESIGMSGTFLMDRNMTGLFRWLNRITSFPVDEDNYMVALGDTVAQRIDCAVPQKFVVHRAKFTPAEFTAYRKVASIKQSGLLQPLQVRTEDRAAARGLAVSACKRDLLPIALTYLREDKSRRIKSGGGVMVIVDSEAEGKEYAQQLCDAKELRAEQMLVINGTQSVNLTAHSTDLPEVCLVFVPRTYPAGFNLTRCDVVVSRVMSDIPASIRAQLEGRVNRMGQVAKEVIIVYVVDEAGYLDQALREQNYTRNLNASFSHSFERTKL